MAGTARRRWLAPAVLLVSASGLAYEVTLTRVFSIGQWHHLAYMVISLAMLGFAASGTAIALLRRRVRGREPALFRLVALLLVPALPGCYALSQQIPFETFQITSQPAPQLGWLSLLYLVLSLPFFLVSACVVLAFLIEAERVGWVYLFDLAGSALGALGVVGLLFVVRPSWIPLLLSLPAAAAALVAGLGAPAGRRRAAWAAGLLVAAAGAALVGSHPVRISEYKGLSYALDLPGARIVAAEESPLSVLDAVSAETIRETPGQISGYPMGRLGPLPEQVALFFDAGASSVVNRWDGTLPDPSRWPGGGTPEAAPAGLPDTAATAGPEDSDPAGEATELAWLDYVTTALPYRVVERPRTLVIGAGGGTEVLNALLHGALHVTAVEVDPSVFPVVRRELGEFSGHLYSRDDVTPVVADGRGWLASHPDARYDLIQIALLDSFSAAAAGVHALSESYLYTVDAVALYLDRLAPGGALAVTRWLETPPRDAIKMFATLVEAAERAGIEEPGRHLAFLRSWNTGTLVLTKRPLTGRQTEAVRAFARERSLDLAWLPGLAASEANRYTVLEEPIYHDAARRILSARREAFYEGYAFHVRPATDGRPYFFRFFRWESLPRLIEGLGSRWLDVVEWGYVALVATTAQALAAALLLVLAPLAVATWWRRRDRDADAAAPWPTGRTVVYFGCLGLAYLFLEIAFIQRFTLFLAYPVYAIAVVLAAFLAFSGLGSGTATRLARGLGEGDRGRRRLVGAAAVAIAALAGLYLVALPPLFTAWSPWPDVAKIAVSLALLAPLAFAMGLPFPSGLQLVSDRHRDLVPWAWAVNGAASVVGAALATLLAVHLGFAAVVWTAVGLYGLAALTVGGLASAALEGGGAPAGDWQKTPT